MARAATKRNAPIPPVRNIDQLAHMECDYPDRAESSASSSAPSPQARLLPSTGPLVGLHQVKTRGRLGAPHWGRNLAPDRSSGVGHAPAGSRPLNRTRLLRGHLASSTGPFISANTSVLPATSFTRSAGRLTRSDLMNDPELALLLGRHDPRLSWIFPDMACLPSLHAVRAWRAPHGGPLKR